MTPSHGEVAVLSNDTNKNSPRAYSRLLRNFSPSAEQSIVQFKHKAHRRAHRWGRDEVDRRRRYRRHLRRLREEIAQAQLDHAGSQRVIFDDLGEAIEDEAD